MSNSTQWHKHEGGEWHRATGYKPKPEPEFKYEQLGTPYMQSLPMSKAEAELILHVPNNGGEVSYKTVKGRGAGRT